MMRWSINVLLVDDDPADTSLTLNALQRHPDVAAAHAMDDPVAALKLLEAGSLLLDINMPKMSGFGFIERLRLIPALSDTPVTFLTTSGRLRDIEAARDCGSCAYVVKPDTLADLRARLDTEIRRAKTRAQR